MPRFPESPNLSSNLVQSSNSGYLAPMDIAKASAKNIIEFQAVILAGPGTKCEHAGRLRRRIEVCATAYPL